MQVFHVDRCASANSVQTTISHAPIRAYKKVTNNEIFPNFLIDFLFGIYFSLIL